MYSCCTKNFSDYARRISVPRLNGDIKSEDLISTCLGNVSTQVAYTLESYLHFYGPAEPGEPSVKLFLS